MGTTSSRSNFKNGSESSQDTASTASSSQKSALEEEVQDSEPPSPRRCRSPSPTRCRSSSPEPSARRPYRGGHSSKRGGLAPEHKAPEQREQKVSVQCPSIVSGSTSMTQETPGSSEPCWTPSIFSPLSSSGISSTSSSKLQKQMTTSTSTYASTRSGGVKQDDQIKRSISGISHASGKSKHSDVTWRVQAWQEKKQLASKWQTMFEQGCSKRDGIAIKDQFIRDGVIEEAIAELQEWGLGEIQHSHDFLQFMFFALTGLFTGLVKNGDQSARIRRNIAVQKGLLEMLVATSRENMRHSNGGTLQHCILGTLHQLLHDHGDDNDVFKRQAAAVSLGCGGIHTICAEALEAYDTHEGVIDCVKKTLKSLAPAVRNAGLLPLQRQTSEFQAQRRISMSQESTASSDGSA